MLYGSGHHHLVPEIFVQLRRHSDFRSPGDRCRLSAGEVLLVPPGVVHEEALATGGSNLIAKVIDARLGYHLTVLPSRRRARRFVREVLTMAGCDSPAALLNDAARRLHHAPQQSLADRAVEEARELVALALRLLSGHLAAYLGAGESVALLDRCRQLALEGLADPDLQVGRVADACGCHPDHLSRLARRHWGCSLQTWISQRRIERAQAMLGTPSFPIAEVARRCGFSDARYFSRVFGRQIGCSPSRYRRKLANAGRRASALD